MRLQSNETGPPKRRRPPEAWPHQERQPLAKLLSPEHGTDL